jgi:MGT family glycosyltransferase
MARFLFATLPADGHFKPLTGLAVHLRDLGHDVRWYTGPSYARHLEGLGIPHLPYDQARDVNGENIAELFPERAGLSGPKLIAFDFERIFVDNCEAHFRDIEAIRRDFPFDAIIADDGLYAIKLVHEKLGVPVYAVGVAPLMFNSRDAPPNFFGLKPARTPVGRVRDRVVDALLRSTMKQGVARFNELLVAEGLTPLGSPRDFFDLPARASRRFFQSGVPGFEYPRSDLPENVRFVGALLPHQRASAEPLPHEDRLRSSHSVVVVSQGTVDNRDPEKLIAPTLEALAGTDHLVVATTGGRNTAELRRRFPAENLLVEDWIDFNRLMPHASLFICNGGFGSIMLAFGNGLPVLSAGKREGKNDVNARIDHFGLGIDLRTEQPTAKQIARGVERILRDDGYAQRVARLRAELQTYDPFERIAHEIAASGGVITSPPGPPR